MYLTPCKSILPSSMSNSLLSSAAVSPACVSTHVALPIGVHLISHGMFVFKEHIEGQQ